MSIESLAPGKSRIITIPVEVGGAAGCSTFDNSSSVDYVYGYGVRQGGHVSSNTVTLSVGCADLTIAKVPERPRPGGRRRPRSRST